MATLAVAGRADLTDAQWAVLGPLLPGGRRARPPEHAKRKLIDGIRWRARAGPSRGGLTTKVHLACEQHQKPLSIIITAGQRGDSPQFLAVLEGIRVPRPGPRRGRSRTR